MLNELLGQAKNISYLLTAAILFLSFLYRVSPQVRQYNQQKRLFSKNKILEHRLKSSAMPADLKTQIEERILINDYQLTTGIRVADTRILEYFLRIKMSNILSRDDYKKKLLGSFLEIKDDKLHLTKNTGILRFTFRIAVLFFGCYMALTVYFIKLLIEKHSYITLPFAYGFFAILLIIIFSCIDTLKGIKLAKQFIEKVKFVQSQENLQHLSK